MKHLWLFRSLVIAGCLLMIGSACRRKRPAVDTPPASAATTTTPQEPVPDLPTAAQPKVGSPMPPMTTEMMLNFEARFGRPPTNYNELSRLKSELPRK